MIVAFLRTIFSRFLLLLLMIIYCPILLICLCIPQRILFSHKFFFYISAFFYQFILKCSFLPITFIGKENIPHEPAIFASNHQSSLDIPILGSLVGISSDD